MTARCRPHRLICAVLKLLDLRDELKRRCVPFRSPGHVLSGPAGRLMAWVSDRRNLGYLLGSWRCPNDNDPTTCNPCGKNSGKDDSWGSLNGGGGWEHIACRTYDMTPKEFPNWNRGRDNINRTGVVTTIHLTDLKIPGARPPPHLSRPRHASAAAARHQAAAAAVRDAIIRQPCLSSPPLSHVRPHLPGTLESMGEVFCKFQHLREFDVDGSLFVGPIPQWVSTCFRARAQTRPAARPAVMARPPSFSRLRRAFRPRQQLISASLISASTSSRARLGSG